MIPCPVILPGAVTLGRRRIVDFDVAVDQIDDPVDGNRGGRIIQRHLTVVSQAGVGHLDQEADVGESGVLNMIILSYWSIDMRNGE